MKPAFVASSPSQCPSETEDATERLEARFGVGDPFGPLDSDDIEWLQQQAARRAKEARRCAFCGTTLHPVSAYAEDCPSIGRHQERCRTASPAERDFYRDHRRWPRAGQVDAAEGEAA